MGCAALEYQNVHVRPSRIRGTAGSKLFSAVLPRAAERDPEREQDQADVEREARTANVDPVVLELVAAGDVAWRENLRDAGEARADGVPLDVARHRLHRDVGAVAGRLDLAGPKRARTDEAHVA